MRLSSVSSEPGQRWARRGAALASGILLALSRPGPDIGLLALVGLVPLLCAIRDVRPRTAALLGLITGCTYYGIVVSWAWYFGAVAIVPFALVLGAYWSAACATLAALRTRGLVRVVATTATWVVFDAIVGRWPFGGFSWGELGYAMHDVAAVRSLAALGGLALVTAVVVFVNATIAEAIGTSRRDQVRYATAIGVVALVTGIWFAAWPRLERTGTLRVAMLQGNDINRDLTDAEIAAFTLPNQHFDLADQLQGQYDLVVFPESAFHPEVVTNPTIVARTQELARRLQSYVMINGVADLGNDVIYNRNVLYDPTGAEVGSYDKRHLVPFGEWVPWRSTLQRYISALDRIPRDFTPGTKSGILTVRGHRIASVICFESAFGPMVRTGANQGAELVVVSTNNRSYRRSANSEQHIALGQLRAAETGRQVLHASVSGATAVIDDRGTVVRSTEMFRNQSVTTEATTRRGSTVYMRFGEWVSWLAAGVVTALVFVAVRRRRRDRATQESVPTLRSSEPTTESPTA